MLLQRVHAKSRLFIHKTRKIVFIKKGYPKRIKQKLFRRPKIGLSWMWLSIRILRWERLYLFITSPFDLPRASSVMIDFLSMLQRLVKSRNLIGTEGKRKEFRYSLSWLKDLLILFSFRVHNISQFIYPEESLLNINSKLLDFINVSVRRKPFQGLSDSSIGGWKVKALKYIVSGRDHQGVLD